MNAINHGRDPLAVSRRPVRYALRGCRPGGMGIHREVLRRTGPLPTLVAWAQNIPNVDAVLTFSLEECDVPPQ